jgi:hypothetical protein
VTNDQAPNEDITVTGDEPKLTPESAKALADKVMENTFIPKKVPDAEDIDAQIKAVGGALASALLTATEVPLHMLQPWVADLSAQLVALGIRQTQHVDPEAVHAPHWITDGVRQESIKLPDPPQHTDAEPVAAMTAEAPKCPKRIKAAARAVRR